MTKRILAGTLACWLAVGSGWAAGNQRNLERETQIETELGTKYPELVEPFRAARVAFDQEDYATAARLLQDITAKAPDYDVGYRRLGACLVREGKRAEGLALCNRAVSLNRSAENLTTLAYSLIGPPATPRDEDYLKALSLLRECRTKPHGTELDILALTAEIALKLNDRAEFATASALLAQHFPGEMVTHYFGAIAAALQEHWVQAQREITRAEKLGLPHEAAQKFLDSGVRSGARWARLLRTALWLFALWLGGLALLFALGFVLSKLTLGQVRPAAVPAAVTPGERLVRRIYRVVMNVAGVYYYLSLPMVIALVVGIVVVFFYACLSAGRIPIKFMLLLVIGAVLTIVAMIKSLLLRIESADPGRPLQRPEAPGLWQLTEEVAQSVGTRPIDEIRITPGTDLAVYERGTWREKLRNQAQRVLILGTGVLTGFKQNDFRCVLAHEYGHYAHRDTAGGDIALQVRTDMLKFYLAMRAAGQATYFNAAFHFLRFYNFLFRRISHGATRLQEILADRVAAQIYGAPAFQGGLTHVIRRSLEFEAAADAEIKQSLAARRPLQNLYELPPPASTELATQFDKALNRPTTEDDTHPSPRDRFQLVAPFQEPTSTPRSGEVWDLFANPDAIRREMVAVVETRVAPHRARAAGGPAAG